MAVKRSAICHLLLKSRSWNGRDTILRSRNLNIVDERTGLPSFCLAWTAYGRDRPNENARTWRRLDECRWTRAGEPNGSGPAGWLLLGLFSAAEAEVPHKLCRFESGSPFFFFTALIVQCPTRNSVTSRNRQECLAQPFLRARVVGVKAAIGQLIRCCVV
jgi:hypothetical protein